MRSALSVLLQYIALGGTMLPLLCLAWPAVGQEPRDSVQDLPWAPPEVYRTVLHNISSNIPLSPDRISEILRVTPRSNGDDPIITSKARATSYNCADNISNIPDIYLKELCSNRDVVNIYSYFENRKGGESFYERRAKLSKKERGRYELSKSDVDDILKEKSLQVIDVTKHYEEMWPWRSRFRYPYSDYIIVPYGKNEIILLRSQMYYRFNIAQEVVLYVAIHTVDN